MKTFDKIKNAVMVGAVVAVSRLLPVPEAGKEARPFPSMRRPT